MYHTRIYIYICVYTYIYACIHALCRQHSAAERSFWRCVAVCCRVSLCVAACCSVFQRITVSIALWHSTHLQHTRSMCMYTCDIPPYVNTYVYTCIHSRIQHTLSPAICRPTLHCVCICNLFVYIIRLCVCLCMRVCAWHARQTHQCWSKQRAAAGDLYIELYVKPGFYVWSYGGHTCHHLFTRHRSNALDLNLNVAFGSVLQCVAVCCSVLQCDVRSNSSDLNLIVFIQSQPTPTSPTFVPLM